MDAMIKRLKKLDKDVNNATAVANIAKEAFLSATRVQQREEWEEVWHQRVDQFSELLDERKQVTAQLMDISGKPPLLHNVQIIYNYDSSDEVERTYTSATQPNLVKALEGNGIDAVRVLADPPLLWTTPGDMEFKSNTSYVVDSARRTFQNQVARSSPTLQQFAKDHLLRDILEDESCKDAQLLHINTIEAEDGSQREVDAAAYAQCCAWIAKARIEPTADSVYDLSIVIRFIRREKLVGEAVQLKRDRIQGVLVGAGLPRQKGEVERLLHECKKRDIILRLPSGRVPTANHASLQRMQTQRPRCKVGTHMRTAILAARGRPFCNPGKLV